MPHGRIVVHADAGVVEEACLRLERVFGLVSLSVAARTPVEIEAIGDAAVARGARRARRAVAARQLQGREPPLRQALPHARRPEISRLRRRARHRRDRAGGRRPSAGAAHRRRGRDRQGLRLRRRARGARRAAGRHRGPRPAAAVGRHRLAGRRLAGRQARPGAGRGLLSFAAVHRRELQGQGRRARQDPRALAGAALGHRRPLHRRAEGAARRRARPSWRWSSTAA